MGKGNLRGNKKTMTQTTTYSEKLRNPNWQKKRLEIMERDKWSCLDCGSGLKDGKTLHVHHIEYKFGVDPWNYPDTNYETLCLDCHADRHKKELEKAEPLIGTSEKDDAMQAAFSILYQDLKGEIARLINDGVEPMYQVNFITEYENVQVEYFLVWLSINDTYTTEIYRSAVRFATRFNRPVPQIEQFTFTRYFDLKSALIKKVIEQIVADHLLLLKGSNGIDQESSIQKHIQKLTTLKVKFIQSLKTDKR